MKESGLAGHSQATNPNYSLSHLPFFYTLLLSSVFELHTAARTVICSSWRDKDLILSGGQNIVDQLKIHLEQTGGGESVSFISRICAVGALCYFRRQKRCGKWQKLGDCEVVALTSWTSTS